MAVKGFKLVTENNQLSVAHGHGHYHSGGVAALADIGDLIDKLCQGKSTSEVAEIMEQAEQFKNAISGAVPKLSELKVLTDALNKKLP